jgi:ferredoxin
MERSLVGILAAFHDEGFTYDFRTLPGGIVECGECHAPHPADALELHHLERLEGDSDPAEMLAVCAVACPNCGMRGTLVLMFGPEATREDDDVFVLLADARRSGE